MTKTSTIKEIIATNEYKNDFWTTYYIKMKLENWETITLWKKNKDAFKVWDTVNYEDYVDAKWYTKQREVKENKKPEYKQDQRWYFTSIAFQIAFQNYSWEDSYKYCSDLARRIFADMLDNYESKQPEEEKKSEPKKEEEVDLPF